MQANCPFIGGDNNTSPLDSTSTTFDNAYFSELLGLNGLLHSDQELFSSNGTGSTNSTVSFYSSNSTAFFIDFANAMVKMGNLSVLTGSNGEIRTNCRKVNSNSSTLLHTKVSHALVNALFDYM